MSAIDALPSREDVLKHGIPVELMARLHREARAARARAMGAAFATVARRLRRAFGGASAGAPVLETKAL